MIKHSKYSEIKETQISCGKCLNVFPWQTVNAIDADNDSGLIEMLLDLSLLKAKCPHCGNDSFYPCVFLYIHEQRKRIWLVVPDGYEVRHLFSQQLFTSLIDKYCEKLSPNEIIMVKAAEKAIITRFMFLKLMGAENAIGAAKGKIHFSPFPEIDFSNIKTIDFEDDDTSSIPNFGISFSKGNIPDFFTSFWETAENEIRYNRYFLPTSIENEKKKSIGTYGIPELVFFLASSVALPIFLGVISNLLTSSILAKKSAKRELKEKLAEAKKHKDPYITFLEERIAKLTELQKNDFKPSDELIISFNCKDVKKKVQISGSIHEVTKEIRTLRERLLENLTMSGDCHICNWIGNKWVDFTFKSDYVGEIESMSQRFKKIFNKSTRVHFLINEYNEPANASVKANLKAKELMNEKRFAEAIEVLNEHLHGEHSLVDTLFNYAQCLFELGLKESGLFFMEQVIVKSLNLPNLEESELFLIANLNEDEIKQLKVNINENIKKIENGEIKFE